MANYTKEQLERREKSGWEYDAKGRPAKAMLSFKQAMDLVERYGMPGTTDEQKEACAQYMIDRDTALVDAEVAVLGVEDWSAHAKDRYLTIWLTR
jgi:hypothetical protein